MSYTFVIHICLGHRHGYECHSSTTAIVWLELLVERYVSNTASFVPCAVYSVKDCHNLQNYSSTLMNTCVRQVVLNKWFPLMVMIYCIIRILESLRPLWYSNVYLLFVFAYYVWYYYVYLLFVYVIIYVYFCYY